MARSWSGCAAIVRQAGHDDARVSPGDRYSAVLRRRGETAPPRVLAALRPKMLELSGTLADGAHTYLVTADTPGERVNCSVTSPSYALSRPLCSRRTARSS